MVWLILTGGDGQSVLFIVEMSPMQPLQMVRVVVLVLGVVLLLFVVVLGLICLGRAGLTQVAGVKKEAMMVRFLVWCCFRMKLKWLN